MTGIPAIAPYPLPATGELPANTAHWSFDPARAVLLVHDMQRYFVGALPAGLRRDLLGNAALLRAHCAGLGVPVAYTAQPGGMSEQHRGLLKDFWGPGMRTAEADRQIVAELRPAPGDLVLTKWRYSAFHRSRLLSWMRGQGRDQLVLCGVYAHIGVLATAVDAFSHDIETLLVADAVADFSQERHRLALRYAAECCATVVTTKEVTA
ncbi:isochorismatase family protein [Streptomyces sp. NPDC050418]|uniref:isochorismatase family protein n=1 Tax=Streptomyces sp. NPDC050418 TaxID=3365612 RepID=UPI0037970D93